MSKAKKKDWTLQHHDGVDERCMIARPVTPRAESPFARFPGDDQAVALPLIVQQHTLEVAAYVDGKRVGHVLENEDAHYPDDGIPYVYDGKAGIVKALRGLADAIGANLAAGDGP